MSHRIRKPPSTACSPRRWRTSAARLRLAQFNGTTAHSGNNRLEKRLTRNNVAVPLTQLFQVDAAGEFGRRARVLRRVSTPGGCPQPGVRDDHAGHIRAYDAVTGASCGASSSAERTSRRRHRIDPIVQFVYSYGPTGT
jgi:hypothetical protein